MPNSHITLISFCVNLNEVGGVTVLLSLPPSSSSLSFHPFLPSLPPLFLALSSFLSHSPTPLPCPLPCPPSFHFSYILISPFLYLFSLSSSPSLSPSLSLSFFLFLPPLSFIFYVPSSLFPPLSPSFFPPTPSLPTLSLPKSTKLKQTKEKV